jgi:hypothetical protein
MSRRVVERLTGRSVLDAVSRLPLDFRARDVSMRQLLEESGFVSDPRSVSVEQLVDMFEAHPELVEAWVRESEDTRSSSYPWIRPPDSKHEYWTVGPSALSVPELWETFSSAAEACAAYVNQYIHLVAR